MARKQDNDKIKQTSQDKRVGPPYDAITLDTCIYESFNFQFNTQLLTLLKDMKIKRIISDIMYYEIIDHLKKIKLEAKATLKKTNKELKKYCLSNSDTINHFTEISNFLDGESYKNNLNEYLDEHNCAIIASDEKNQKEIISRYFSRKPPFNEGKNKHEFPDAIALLSLESWAENNSQKILAVSGDASWLAFSEQSKYIDVVSNLKIGLADIQEHDEAVEKWIYQFIADFMSLTLDQKLLNLIDIFLETRITEHINESYADEYDEYPLNNYFVTSERITSIEYHEDSLKFSDDEHELKLIIVKHAPENTTFYVSCIITVSAGSEFKHSTEKNHEKYTEEIHLGDSEEYVEAVEIPVQLGFTLKGNVIAKGYTPEISDINIVGELLIPFNDISLLYSDDEWDFLE